jgi:hypothetical protein
VIHEVAWSCSIDAQRRPARTIESGDLEVVGDIGHHLADERIDVGAHVSGVNARRNTPNWR